MRYLIQNGIIVDGTGNRCFPGSVLIEDDRIAEVIPEADAGQKSDTVRGQKPDADCSRKMNVETPVIDEKGLRQNSDNELIVIDAKGGYITPGFVDIHRHGDWKALTCGDDELLNRQGITTVINGNCGLSAAPQAGEHERETEHFLRSFLGRKPENFRIDPAASMHQYFTCLRMVKRSVHTGILVGGGSVRASVAGYAAGALTKEQEALIRERIRESLDAGAVGVSLGMGYDPAFAYNEDDLVRVLAPVKGAGIPVAVHIRTEGDGAAEAVGEMIRVSERLKAPLHLSHMKCIGKRNWRVTCQRELELVREALSKGLDITMDAYPYITGATQLVHLIPPRFLSGGTDDLIACLKDERMRALITRELKQPSERFENIVELAGFDHIAVTGLQSGSFLSFEGCTIARIAKELGRDPYDTLYDILLEEELEPAMLDTYGCEQDMIDFLREDYCSLISDAIYPEGGCCHPRVYDSFPRFLIRYVRERAVFSIEEAVRKMTSLPASLYALDRGILKKGMPADLCVFLLENLKSQADFDHPDRMCTGFDYVFTAGSPCVVKDVWKNSGNAAVLTGRGR